MTLRIEQTGIPNLVIAHVPVFTDARGSFREMFSAEQFAAANLPASVAQVNLSRSHRGAVRGLHFQWEPPMAKTMRVVRGRAFLVAVDVRKQSPTCGRAWWRETVVGEDLWIAAPAGFARGLQALEDDTEVEYLCSHPRDVAKEAGIRWDDPALGIPWPIPAAIVSEKDRAAPTLAEWLAGPQGHVFDV